MKKRFIAAIATAAALTGLYVHGTNIQNTCVAGNPAFENGTGLCNVKNRAALDAKATKAESKPALVYGKNAEKPSASKADHVKQQAILFAKAEAKGEWHYSTYTDDATGKTAKAGSLSSKNSMNFDFPYSGTQHGRFVVRNHPRYGVDAYLSIKKGQLLCNSYNNPTVLVRFDNGEASSYSCNSPADHSRETVFIEGVGRLEARMKTAKKMYVTVSVYGEGSRTWEFNVKNYDSSKI